MRFVLSISVCFLILSCTTKKDLDISKYPIITTAAELSEYYDLKLDKSGEYESSAIIKYLDGSKELEYSYDLAETKYFDPLIYYITIQQERSVRDAKEVYVLGKTAIRLTGNSFNQGTIEIDSLMLPGDEYYYALRTYNDVPNGMFYTVRKGARIYTMMISGVYTSDHSLLYDLILPRIESLETYDIRK